MAVEQIFFDSVPSHGTLVLLGLALAIALGFEVVNGFHDTANAVATVIYTRSLKPWVAVVLSGLFNFIGVMTSGVGVAYAVVNLLPVELLVGSRGEEFAMVFAVLLGALIWNLGTWYYGLPASSSHTLIGAIIGVGIARSVHEPGLRLGQGVHWNAVKSVGVALITSPLAGFILAAALLKLMTMTLKDPALYRSPEGEEPPPLWIRSLLVLTSCGVSFAHGSNDGQKGMGLVMLILIGLVPASFAIDLTLTSQQLQATVAASGTAETVLLHHLRSGPYPGDPNTLLQTFIDKPRVDDNVVYQLAHGMQLLRERLTQYPGLLDIPPEERWPLRTNAVVLYRALVSLGESHMLLLEDKEQQAVTDYRKSIKNLVEYVCWWVKLAVALALGIGTMIGWKRVVVTIGEKIGKTQLNYAQGLAAQSVAMLTILAGDRAGLPVSTTHILASGVAGTMQAGGSGLQGGTLRNIILAWVFTLPASMTLSSGLYYAFRLLT